MFWEIILTFSVTVGCVVSSRIADPHNLNEYPDPSFHFNEGPDPHPACSLSKWCESATTLVYRPSRALFWASTAPLWLFVRVHVTPRYNFAPLKLLNLDFNAEPDPAFTIIRILILIQLSQRMQIHADPDPQLCWIHETNSKQCWGSGSVCFFGLPDPHPDLLVTSTHPSIIKQKKERPRFLLYCNFLWLFISEECCKCTSVPNLHKDQYIFGPPGSASGRILTKMSRIPNTASKSGIYNANLPYTPLFFLVGTNKKKVH